MTRTLRHAADRDSPVTDIDDLRAFTYAADLRSFTGAAKLMGESTANVSRRISRLESALGVSLLRRTPRAVEPTEEGAAYRVRLAEILELLGDANAAVRGAASAPSGHLRVTAPPGLECVLAPLFARFAGAYPAVTLTAMVTERFVDLDAEHVDVALRATGKLADSSLVAHKLFDFDVILVAAPAYLEEHGAPKRVEDLAAHRTVRFDQARTPSPIVMRPADGTGEPVEVVSRYSAATTDASFARELAVAGAGIALLGQVLVQSELDAGRLVHVLRPWVAPGHALYLMHRSGRFLPPKVRAFRELMIRECATVRRARPARARTASTG